MELVWRHEFIRRGSERIPFTVVAPQHVLSDEVV
jgi:hypothetical protein